MAIKYFCDRCHKEIRNNDTPYYHLIVFKDRDIKDIRTPMSSKKLDLELCEACYNYLEQWARIL